MGHLENTQHHDRHYTKVVIQNPEGDILLLNHQHIVRQGLMLPGGVCEASEHPIDTLKRELQEELVGGFSFESLRIMVHQILKLPREDFFRYGSLYHMAHNGDITIQESEQTKFGKTPIWIPRQKITERVDYLAEDNRLMILQILRIYESQRRIPEINITHIR